jgi:hypothetical protein
MPKSFSFLRACHITDKRAHAIFIFFLLLFIIESTFNFGLNGTKSYADSRTYEELAKISIFTKDFWYGIRPIGIPLFYKVVNLDSHLIVATQNILYITTWSLLAALIFFNQNKKTTGLALALLSLYLALDPEIWLWNNIYLSESINISVWVSILGLTYHYSTTSKKLSLFALVALSIYYSTLRDTNAYQILILLPVIIFLTWRKSKILCLFSATLLLVAFVWSSYSSEGLEKNMVKKRWTYPILNTISQRILSDPDALSFFSANGMPVTKELLSMEGKWANSDNLRYYRSKNLADFRLWLMSKGKQTYIRYLISHPSYFFEQPLIEHQRILAFKECGLCWRAPNNSVFNKITSISHNNRLFIFAGLSVLLLALIATEPSKRALMIKPIFIWGIIIIGHLALALVTYHGDAMDVERHSLIIPISMKLCLIMILGEITLIQGRIK